MTDFSLTIVESIPENLTYVRGSPLHTSTYQGWMSLLAAAHNSVDIASYYWTLRGRGNVSDVTDKEVVLFVIQKLKSMNDGCSSCRVQTYLISLVAWQAAM